MTTPRCKCCKCCLTTEQAVSQPQMQNHDSSDAKAPHRTNVFGPVGVSSPICARVPVRISTREIDAPEGLRADALTHAREGRLVTDGGRRYCRNCSTPESEIDSEAAVEFDGELYCNEFCAEVASGYLSQGANEAERDVEQSEGDEQPPHIRVDADYNVDAFFAETYAPGDRSGFERMDRVDEDEGGVVLETWRDDGPLTVFVSWGNGLGITAIDHDEMYEQIAEVDCHHEHQRDDGTRVFLADDERYEFAIELRKRGGDAATSGGESA